MLRHIKNPRLILAIACILLFTKAFLQCWGVNATWGGFSVLLLAPIVVQSLIIGIVALLIALTKKDVRKYWLITFAWLLLADGIVALSIHAYTKFSVEPKIDQLMSDPAVQKKMPPETQYKLAKMYEAGIGMSQDMAKGFDLTKEAAEGGLLDAQYDVALLYSMQKNYVPALMWANIAVSRSYIDATKLRDILQKTMTTEQISEAQRLSTQWSAEHH